MAKQSVTDARTALEAEKEVFDRANAVWATARMSESQAQEELAMVRAKLKRSWELEAQVQTRIKKAQAELEGILPILTYPFISLFSLSDLYSVV